MEEKYFINKKFKFEAAHRIWKQDLSNSRRCEFTEFYHKKAFPFQRKDELYKYD